MNKIYELILKYLPFLVQASASVPEIIAFVHEMRDIFKRENVWTEDEERAFDAKLEDVTKNDPAWQRRD